MIKLPLNKLWALPATAEALKTAEGFEYCYAEPDHILVVSEKKPRGAKEITEEFVPLLTGEDWAWLMICSESIRRQQEEQFRKELQEKQDEFFKRFEDGLKRLREEGGRNGGEETE